MARYSIGEFSQLSGLTVKTLRFYHDRDILTPASIDVNTSYRYYDDKNLERARVVVALRSLEFSLEEVGEILADYDDEADILEFLQRRKTDLQSRIRAERNLIAQLDTIIQRETEARAIMTDQTYDVVEKEIDPMLVAGVRMTGKYSDCGKGFSQIGRRFGRHLNGKPFCLFYDGEYRENDANFEPCMPVRKTIDVEGIHVRELDGGRCVSLLHKGPYDEIKTSYAKLMHYVKERDYELLLPSREVYIKGPGMIFKGNPKKYLTEIQFIVREFSHH